MHAGFQALSFARAFAAARSRSLNLPVPTAIQLSTFYGETLQPFQIIERPFAKELFETGYSGTYSAAVSGGTPGATYYVNGRYYRENGPFGGEQLGPARDLDRKAQGSASLVILPSDRLKVHVTSEYVDAHHETPNNNNNIYAPLTNAIFGHPELASCTTRRDSSLATGDGHCTGAGNPEGVASFGTVREDMQRTTKQGVKHFTGSLLPGAAERYRGFKCPHCKLFVPAKRASTPR